MPTVLVDTGVFSYLLKGDSRANAYAALIQGQRVALSFMTVAELFQWAAVRTWGQRRRAHLGAAWEDNGLVFSNSLGRPIDNINLLKYWFFPLLKQAGLPGIRFHDLRHTAATLLIGQRVNIKVVSEMLGHSEVSITLRVYAHVMPHMQREAVHAMDTLLGRE